MAAIGHGWQDTLVHSDSTLEKNHENQAPTSSLTACQRKRAKHGTLFSVWGNSLHGSEWYRPARVKIQQDTAGLTTATKENHADTPTTQIKRATGFETKPTTHVLSADLAQNRYWVSTGFCYSGFKTLRVLLIINDSSGLELQSTRQMF